MEELNTLLTVGLLGFGGGVFATAVIVLLVVIYNNINTVSGKLKEDDEGNEGFVIPMSALMGGAGGGGRGVSMADLQAYAARMAAGAGAPPIDTAKTPPPTGGQYL